MTTRIRPIERDDALSLAALRLQQDREVGRATRPGFLTDYADAFVRAWGKGESGAWTYTSDAVELSFGSTNPSGGPRWSRTSSGTACASSTTSASAARR